MPRSADRPDSRRETRLLIVTITVSIAMLLILARFRFPQTPARTLDPAPAPLERLAARATYDELAQIMSSLQTRLAPTVEVIPLQDGGHAGYVVAPRVAGNRAIGIIDRNAGLAQLPSGLSLLSRDDERGIIVFQAEAPGPVASFRDALTAGPRYVAAVQGTALGAVTRPVYVGRTDIIPSPGWSDAVISIAAVQQNLPAGTALFSLDGVFIGLVAGTNGATTVLPASLLQQLAESATEAPETRAWLGLDVQALTPELARAAGAPAGVMVVRTDLSVAGVDAIHTGDVIVSVDDVPITTVRGFTRVAQHRTPGSAVALSIVRLGKPLTVTVTARNATEAPASQEDLGAVLRTISGAGVEIVSVRAGGPAELAGLQRTDLVTAVNGQPAADARMLQRAFSAAPSGTALLLTIQRPGSEHVIALEKP
jgi:S1-C subfamily serine protease